MTTDACHRLAVVLSAVLLCALVAWRAHASPWVWTYMAVSLGAPALVRSDLTTKRVPSVLLSRMTTGAFTALVVSTVWRHDGWALVRAVSCGVAVVLVFGGAALVADGLGGGDVKVAGIVAFTLGAGGWQRPFVALLAAYVTAGGALAVRILRRRRLRLDPGGAVILSPFLVFGWLFVVVMHP